MESGPRVADAVLDALERALLAESRTSCGLVHVLIPSTQDAAEYVTQMAGAVSSHLDAHTVVMWPDAEAGDIPHDGSLVAFVLGVGATGRLIELELLRP